MQKMVITMGFATPSAFSEVLPRACGLASVRSWWVVSEESWRPGGPGGAAATRKNAMEEVEDVSFCWFYLGWIFGVWCWFWVVFDCFIS